MKLSNVIVIVFLLGFPVIHSYAQNNVAAKGELIVQLTSNEATSLLTNEFGKINGVNTELKVVSTISNRMNLFLLSFNPNKIDVDFLLQLLAQNKHVIEIQKNHFVEDRDTPNDSAFANQWHLENTGQNGGLVNADIGATDAWNIVTGGLSAQGDTIVVAVIEGGFDLNHIDLNFWRNYNEIPNNNIDDDNNGYTDDYNGWNTSNLNDEHALLTHGTLVSGVIGAKGNNGYGISGVSWNVKIMPVSQITGLESDILAAYAYIIDQRKLYDNSNGSKGAFVVATNSSFGLDLEQPASHPLWCAMYDSLGAVGILNAAATSNSNINVDTQGDIPTACSSDWLITVTNTKNDDSKAIAGFGANTIDLGAPGTDILSTAPNNKYKADDGTSLAAPQVAGSIGLLFGIQCNAFITEYKSNPDSIALIIKDSILSNVDKKDTLKNLTLSGGRLNIYKTTQAIYNKYLYGVCSLVDTSIIGDTIAIPKVNVDDSLFVDLNIIGVQPDKDLDHLIVHFRSIENCDKVNISLFNLFGKPEKTYTFDNTQTSGNIISANLDVKYIASGIYFLQIECGGKKSPFKKVLIQQY